MVYPNLLNRLKPLRNLGVDYLKLICRPFKVQWLFVSGYANNFVYTP